ncbi:hypothetical protein P154DRAFT_565573 [Amniculicola lignicola CBS 123094]|uniref:Jacalin-type lectin domain-containing protein n=1 Tax=Amniculicola lignicola CBS 123094 TaxID=1392246 RepID=A0A6A5W7I8_9PLEO|nr:hypothetical protein P154DRAFT_565573 [Amniculicola lignicola CBS 123094]
MLFTSNKLVVGATYFIAGLTSVVKANDCWDGPFAGLSQTGGGGGGEFCDTKWKEGVVVTGFEAWANSKNVRAFQLYYSDGSNSRLYGKIDGDKHARIDWDPAVDSISQIRTWGNGRAESLGRVQIRTKAGKELDVGKDTNGQDTFETEIGTGIMMGAFGGSGDYIDRLGFSMLRGKIDKISIDDVVFDEDPEALNARMEGLKTVTLDYADHTNDHPEANETFSFGKTETRTASKKFSSTASHTFGWSNAIELSGKILDLGASSTTTLKYEYSKATTEESTTETSVTLTYTVATALKPGQRVFCRATAMYGEYDGDYASTVNIWLEDGFTFGFKSGGNMKQIQWSDASSVCQDTDFAPSKRAVKFLA